MYVVLGAFSDEDDNTEPFVQGVAGQRGMAEWIVAAYMLKWLLDIRDHPETGHLIDRVDRLRDELDALQAGEGEERPDMCMRVVRRLKWTPDRLHTKCRAVVAQAINAGDSDLIEDVQVEIQRTPLNGRLAEASRIDAWTW